jgi:glycosyltransferase involved in cell wall biosynthesis
MPDSRFGHGPLLTVSVIVSFLNSAATLEHCLLNIMQQDYPRDLFEVVVVDGGSDDDSITICRRLERRFENLRLISSPGCTEAEGQIVGVESSKGEVLMFTNSDIYVPRDWIRKHVHWLTAGFDLVGGRVFWGGDKFALTWNMPKQNGPRFVQEQGLGFGFSNSSVRRKLFARIGGLRSLRSQQDTEFAFRLVRSGGRMILDPAIEVYHDHPFVSLRKSFLRSLGYTVNHVLIMRACYGRMVAGSGNPARIPLGFLVKEGSGINGVQVYKEVRDRALSAGIRISLPEFVFIRLLSTKLGQSVGVLVGATRRKVTLGSILDLHVRSRFFQARAD